MSRRVLVINPGSTSTKVAVYDDEAPLFVQSLHHGAEQLSGFNHNTDQYPFRLACVLACLEEHGVGITSLSVVAGRGGILMPLASGTYHVRQNMLDELRRPGILDHASNLGAPLAYELARRAGVAAFVVDPVAVDEFEEVARISGLPEVPRLSLSHALNIKAIARLAARDLNTRYEDLNLLVVHLGGGISATAHRRGRMIDVNNATGGRPLLPRTRRHAAAERLDRSVLFRPLQQGTDETPGRRLCRTHGAPGHQQHH